MLTFNLLVLAGLALVKTQEIVSELWSYYFIIPPTLELSSVKVLSAAFSVQRAVLRTTGCMIEIDFFTFCSLLSQFLG